MINSSKIEAIALQYNIKSTVVAKAVLISTTFSLMSLSLLTA
jgi:hypothetical protein